MSDIDLNIECCESEKLPNYVGSHNAKSHVELCFCLNCLTNRRPMSGSICVLIYFNTTDLGSKCSNMNVTSD